ncbi:chemokine (C-C motif) ligand 34b, duplicate 1 precursor [Danio rerio]|uniref:Chemokine (C-C motif) ligand 34b, duplicate 1 n=1 Tax=Danio rerio TaxID=7955 RepID=A0A0R4IPJ5_DANRE|nr:chemokine (C-C motif) ligand 34b, duplicate 1 precursor [Danio rerio]|eukprot:NP_001108526.2 chemokine CCL-C24m precursor [Danio rerio]
MKTQKIFMRSLAVALTASVIWTVTAVADNVESCCTPVSTPELTDPIMSVRIQFESLECETAIVFKTEERELCSDPRQLWVRRKVMQFYKNKVTKKTN